MLFFSFSLILYFFAIIFRTQAHRNFKQPTSIIFLDNIADKFNRNKIIKEKNKLGFVKNNFRRVNAFLNNRIYSKRHKKNLKKKTIEVRLNTNIKENLKNEKEQFEKCKNKKIRKLKSNKSIRDLKKDIKLQFFKKRILYLTDEINKKTSDELISQLLYLDSLNHEDIKIFINSPGGSINEGLAILDIFHFIKSDIQTISFGLVASMGSVILAAGKKGKRKSLPNCRIMIHQPLGNAYGQPEDIEIQTKEILYLRNLLYHYLSVFTNQTTETIRKHSDRDYYMNAYEAKDYGLIDEVVDTKLLYPYSQKENFNT